MCRDITRKLLVKEHVEHFVDVSGTYVTNFSDRDKRYNLSITSVTSEGKDHMSIHISGEDNLKKLKEVVDFVLKQELKE